jgi:T5SS/PEP-CTERM-associated repeat protein
MHRRSALRRRRFLFPVLALAAASALPAWADNPIIYFTASPANGATGPTEGDPDDSYGTIYVWTYSSLPPTIGGGVQSLEIDSPNQYGGNIRSYADPNVGTFSQQGFDSGTTLSLYAVGTPPESGSEVATLLSGPTTYYAPTPGSLDTVEFGYLGPNGPQPPGPPQHPVLPNGLDAYTVALGSNTVAETDAGFFNQPADSSITFSLTGLYTSTYTASLEGQNITLTGQGSFRTSNLTTAGNVYVQNGATLSSNITIIDSDSTGFPAFLTITGNNSQLGATAYLEVGTNDGLATLTVTNGASAQAGNVTIGLGGTNCFAVMTLNGGNLQATGYMTVGNNPGANAAFNVQNGGNATVGIVAIGFGQDSTGIVTVDGQNSLLNSSSYIAVGYASSSVTDSLTVSNGATVTSSGILFVGGFEDGNTTSPGLGTLSILSGATVVSGTGLSAPSLGAGVGMTSTSQGAVLVDGAGTLWDIKQRLNIGYDGLGAVTVEDGATLQVESDVIRLGRDAGSVGFLTFDNLNGASPILTFTGGSASQLLIGDSGTGQFLINNGAAISMDAAAVIGNSTGGTGGAIINGTGSSWSIGDALTVGNAGNGALLIEGGGSVTNSAAAIVGSQAGGVGTITVTDSGSLWHAFQDLTIGQDGQGDVTVRNAATLQIDGDLTLGQDASGVGTLTIDGFSTTLTYGGGDVTIGSAGTGTLTVQNGALADLTGTSITLGDQNSANGAIDVTGSDSTLNTGELTIGSSGTGTLTVDSGATLTTDATTLADQASGTGTATIDGAGSSWTTSQLTVGGAGNGELDIQNGGVVNVSSGDLVLGDEQGSTGTLTLSDSGSQLNFHGQINIGENGTGIFAVQGGASFTAFAINVGDKGGSTGTLNIDGAGSHLEIQHDFNIGESGSGALNVTNTASLHTDADATLADLTGSSGAAVIDASAVWSIGGDLSVGHQGIGGLQISGGSIVSAQNVTLGEIAGSGGTITLAGKDAHGPSTLQVNGTLTIGNAGHGELDIATGATLLAAGHVTLGAIGTLDLRNGGTALLGQTTTQPTAGSLVIASNGTLTDNGHLFATLNLLPHATLAGTGSITGNTTLQSASTLDINISSTATDLLTFTGGEFDAAGVNVQFLPTGQLTDHQSYTFLSFANTHQLNGPITAADFTLLPSGLLGSFVVNTSADTVSFLVGAAAGDANEDGKVDLTDLNIVLAHLGTTTSAWTNGNFDGAPTIDLTDLNDVLNAIGSSAVAPRLPAPQPASLLLFAATLPLLLNRRRTS